MIPIYPFGLTDMSGNNGDSAGWSEQERLNVLGGKGAGLHWMHSEGMSVPPGFVIPTSVWSQYKKSPAATMKAIGKVIKPYLEAMQALYGYMPLLSVRSGARVSCPGMMDTILNVGLDENTKNLWNKKLGPSAYENSLHRLVTMYGSVVRGISRQDLEEGGAFAALAVYKDKTGEDFPTRGMQLLGSIEAVFKSWENERAVIYRKLNNIPAEWGTAVTVQAMVFGNLNDQSGTGVLFTRDPNTGEGKVTGEFLKNAQGEDVVAGTATPMPLDQMAEWNNLLLKNLIHEVKVLEAKRKYPQDVEFTIQDGQLYFLQTRNAKMTDQAIIRSLVVMEAEGILTPAEAVKRVKVSALDRAQIPVMDPSFSTPPDFVGLAACAGIVTGKPVFSSQAAIDCTEPCILITSETTPDDIAGMNAAAGVITMTGGMTSHAAVVARGMNKPCVTGVGKSLQEFKSASLVSFDGSTGGVWLGPVKVTSGANTPWVKRFKELVQLAAPADILPVITEAPSTHVLKEALFYVGDGVYHPEKTFQKIKDMLSNVEKLYIDFTRDSTAEDTMYRTFGNQAVNKLAQLLENEPLMKYAVVLVGAHSEVLKHVATSDSLDDLIMADEVVIGTGSFSTSPAAKKVLEWKAKDGSKAVSLGVHHPGAKSFMSLPQTLQSVASSQ